MPNPGFKSITMKESVYDAFFEYYQTQKIPGDADNFSGFIVQKLNDSITEREHLRKLAKKIKVVPQRFTMPVMKPLKVLQ